MSDAEAYQVKCGRCGRKFLTSMGQKLHHFSIYRALCPLCGWPGRYLASELHPARIETANPPPPKPGRVWK